MYLCVSFQDKNSLSEARSVGLDSLEKLELSPDSQCLKGGDNLNVNGTIE